MKHLESQKGNCKEIIYSIPLSSNWTLFKLSFDNAVESLPKPVGMCVFFWGWRAWEEPGKYSVEVLASSLPFKCWLNGEIEWEEPSKFDLILDRTLKETPVHQPWFNPICFKEMEKIERGNS